MTSLARCLLVVTALSAGSCAYVNHARHWAGGFTASATVYRVGGEGGHVTLPVDLAVCGSDPYVDTSLWMTDLTLAELEAGGVTDGQVLHIEMLFAPRPGWTPIDPHATNLSIRYVVFSDGHVGMYEGGGFGYPVGSVEEGTMSLHVEHATLSLGESTDGFVDLLSPARLEGTFSGPCDTGMAGRVADGVDQLVTNAFGRTIYVRGRSSALLAHR